MRSSRTLIHRAAWFLALVVGCRTFQQPAGDPFAASPQPAAPNTAPATGVVPAGFEQQSLDARGQLPVPPGVSLGKDDVVDQKSWWEKTADRVRPKSIKNSALKMVGLGPEEAIARQHLDDAHRLFREGKYDESAKQYGWAAFRWPDSAVEEEALFMKGECQFFADRYSQASDTYSNLLKKYENSRYLDKIVQRQYAIGRYWDEQGRVVYNYVPNATDKTRPWFDTSGNAVAQYESIRLHDPTGPLADDAILATANWHFLKGHYEDAAYQYDLLRKEYPRSEHQRQAHLLGLQSQMRAYQGSQYDVQPLEQAEKLAEATLVQYVQEMPEERPRLLDMQKQIRFQKAERDWENGEYYYRRKYYGAARYYYQVLARDYPDTPWGQQASDRLEETKNYPAEPPDYFGWMGKIFGERERTRSQ